MAKLTTSKKREKTPQLPSPTVIGTGIVKPMHVETRTLRQEVKPPREWVAQPDTEIGMHGTVAHTFKVLHLEITEYARRIAENKMIIKRMAIEQAKYYSIPHDTRREMTLNEDCSILLVPQFEKQKETEIETPKAAQ